MLNQRKPKIILGIILWLILIIFVFYIPLAPLTLDKQVNAPFLAQNGNKHALVFFGFRGCSNICPITLTILQQFFNSQQNITQRPQVIFVDIDQNSSSAQASEFAKQFHPSFVGYHIPPDQLSLISAKFGLNIKQQKKQISHLGKTYLLLRKTDGWHLVKTYNPDSFSVTTLQHEFQNLAVNTSITEQN